VVYSAVVVATTAAALLHMALTPLIENTAGPFITFFPAVLFAAWFGGFGPAALSTLLSALAASCYFVSFDRLPDPAEGIALLICLDVPRSGHWSRPARTRRHEDVPTIWAQHAAPLRTPVGSAFIDSEPRSRAR
jgi:hypothetical protein